MISRGCGIKIGSLWLLNLCNCQTFCAGTAYEITREVAKEVHVSRERLVIFKTITQPFDEAGHTCAAVEPSRAASMIGYHDAMMS